MMQTFGELVHWHSHIHAVVSEGVFTESGHFVHVPDVWRFCACEIWQEKVFQLLLDEQKIDLQTVSSMRSWRHSGFSIDNSVRLVANDHDGIRRLVFPTNRGALAAIDMAEARGRTVPGEVSAVSLCNEPARLHRRISYCGPDWETIGYLMAHSVIGDMPIEKTSGGFLKTRARVVARATSR